MGCVFIRFIKIGKKIVIYCIKVLLNSFGAIFKKHSNEMFSDLKMPATNSEKNYAALR